MVTTNKVKPTWAGDDLLSRFVNLLIQTKPIYSVMKAQARKVLIKTAEKNGIPWRENVQAFERSSIAQGLLEIEDQSIVYPDYYRVPFHAYDEGNLCWRAAFEAEAATHSMALRIWPEEPLTWQDAQARLRSSFHNVLADYGPVSVKDILDIGCSVGISTRAIHEYYEQQENNPRTSTAQTGTVQTSTVQISSVRTSPVRTVGLDLSPYMLTVAKAQDENNSIAQWIHAKAEDTGLADATFDLVTMQFVIHELPRESTQDIFREVYRLIRPDGCLAIIDNNPNSPVIQNLPPALFTLMKSTEPWTDDYYTFDVESALKSSGFEHVVTVASDPRHRTIIGRKSVGRKSIGRKSVGRKSRSL